MKLGSFLHNHIWYEEYILRLEMFFTNVLSLVPGLQNLWRRASLFLFSVVTLPRLLISKAVTVVEICVMSVRKCAYLLVFF